MNAYRNPSQVIGQILTFTEQTGDSGIRISSLKTKANLSSPKMSKFLENLVGAGLIVTKELEKKNAFIITQKGKEYLKSYRRFIEIAESYGLEL